MSGILKMIKYETCLKRGEKRKYLNEKCAHGGDRKLILIVTKGERK